MHKIAPRGVFTSGKGSSAVGLTAYVTRDPDSKQLVLERYVLDEAMLLVVLTHVGTVVHWFLVMVACAVSMSSTRCRMPLVVYSTK